MTPTGKTVEVSENMAGQLDEDTEFAALTNSIKNGEVVTKNRHIIRLQHHIVIRLGVILMQK